MRIVLVSLPYASVFSPGLGAPMVAADLRRRGHEIRLVDGVMASFRHALAAPQLHAGADFLHQRLAYLEGRDKLSQANAQDYTQTAELLLGAEKVIEQCPSALATLRGKNGDWTTASYDRAISIVQAALRLSSAPFAPETLSLRHYRSPFSLKSEADLLRFAALTSEQSLLGDVLGYTVPQQILAAFSSPPDVIGLSLAWLPQLGAAAMLGHNLRRLGFQGPVVWGGALMAHLADELNKAKDLQKRRIVDHIVVRGGAQALETLEQTPTTNNFVLDHGEIDRAHYREQIETMPRPDFSGIELQSYLSARPVLPLLASVGCYYQGCTFCDHFHSMNGYRPRPIAALLDDIKSLHHDQNCRDFYLVDDCTPPKTMEQLADGLLTWRAEGGPKVHWITECRAEQSLLRPGLLNKLADSGCQMLLLGLESADDDVLKSMNKGVTQAQLSAVIQAIHQSGIKVWTFYMIGFPTETSDAAQTTHDFLVEHAQHIDAIAGGPFMVTRFAPIAKQSEKFGIRLNDAAVPTLRPLNKGTKRRKANKTKAATSLERPAVLDVTVGHSGGAMSREHRDRHLAALRKDPRLAHFLHPLVAEAHALFLPRDYYHQVAGQDHSLPRREGRVDVQALRGLSLSVHPDVSVQFFKYPSEAAQLPASGKVIPQLNAVISRLDRPDLGLRSTVPIGRLVERCQTGPALVTARIAEIEQAQEGRAEDVIKAIIVLVEAGLMMVEANS